MAVAAGSSVANLYYAQPLLTEMARTLSIRHGTAYLPTLTLVGLMIGMIVLVPLGDMFERRRQIIVSCFGTALAMGAVAIAPDFKSLAIASVLVGAMSITHHLILPFASQVAPAGKRGNTLGLVLCGMTIGALLARTLSGFIASALGWRAVYLMAAGWMLGIAAFVRVLLPKRSPARAINYPTLMRSMLTIAQEPELLETAAIGAMLFGALNAFWANLIFFLQTPPYHYGEQMVGLFGLVGAVGAALAPIIGRLADRHGPRLGLSISLTAALSAFTGLWLFSDSLISLVGCVILLDAGVQAGAVSNQARIYALLPSAPSRANTVYMTFYFAGGALGAASGAYAWGTVGWWGVCMVGIAMLLIATGLHFGRNQPTFAQEIQTARSI